MADTFADQAEGLRRLHAAPLPGLCTVLSADVGGDKAALMQRLAASMMKRGRPVILIDAAGGDDRRPSLLDVARGDASLAEAAAVAANGVQQVRLGADRDHPGLSRLLRQIAGAQAPVLVDVQLDGEGRLPLSLLSDGEMVVQLSAGSESIRRAYEILQALKHLCGRGSVSLLVTDTDPVRANKARANLFHAASRYLALPVRSIVPQEARHV